jgi:predicted transcriptional regulator
MKQKRTHYEIFWEILTFCKTPKSFTSIINRCNLNSKIGQTHIEFLKKRHFLAEVENEGMTLLKSTEQESSTRFFSLRLTENFLMTAQNSGYKPTKFFRQLKIPAAVAVER